jgi:CheY-like chemotaxis protein
VNQLVFKGFLKRCGFPVEHMSAENGREALDILKSGHEFDVVLMVCSRVVLILAAAISALQPVKRCLVAYCLDYVQGWPLPVSVWSNPSLESPIQDMTMPVMDGLTCTREMRRLGVTTPIVTISGALASPFLLARLLPCGQKSHPLHGSYCSGNTSADDVGAALEAGATAYLTKPVTGKSFIHTIKRAIGSVDVCETA